MNRALFKSKNSEWATPAWLYERLNAEFHFDFDPCPLGSTEDGLATLFNPWAGKRVFCNAPYGPQISKWLRRAEDADLAVYLIPARTDTQWFHTLVLPKASEIRFVQGRLKFGKHQDPAPFPSLIAIFDKSVLSCQKVTALKAKP